MSIFHCRCFCLEFPCIAFCVFHLKIRNAHYASWFVVDITILSCLSLCGVIHMFLCRMSRRRLSLHDVCVACLVSSFAQQCADVLARWMVTLGAVQKVMLSHVSGWLLHLSGWLSHVSGWLSHVSGPS